MDDWKLNTFHVVTLNRPNETFVHFVNKNILSVNMYTPNQQLPTLFIGLLRAICQSATSKSRLAICKT